MLREKSPVYDELRRYILDQGDTTRLKNAYFKIIEEHTSLSEDDLVNIIASSNDDKDDEDWVKDMLAYTAGDAAWTQRLAEQEEIDLAELEDELPKA